MKRDLHIICKSKIKPFATNQVVANNKLFEMEYNKDDRNRVVEEAQAKLTEAKQVLAKLKKQDLPIIDAICHPLPFLQKKFLVIHYILLQSNDQGVCFTY